MWEVLLCFSSRQIHNQVKIRNIGISEEFMIKFTYNQGKIWNIEMISGDAFLKSSEEEAGFVATQSAVLYSFDFIRVATVTIFNPIQDGLFWGCSRIGGGGCKKTPPLPKICHTYPTMMKLGIVTPCLKKIQKIYESRDTYHDFC